MTIIKIVALWREDRSLGQNRKLRNRFTSKFIIFYMSPVCDKGDLLS